MSKAVISSYATHNDKWWNVSMIYRESSVGYNMWLYETLVWEWDATTKERGRMVHQDEGFGAHFEICAGILNKGAFWENEGEE